MWDVNENESIWDFDVPPPNVLDNSLIAMTPPRRRSSGDSASARSHSHDIPDFFPYARRSSSGSGSNNSRRSNSVGQPQINRRSSSRVYMPSRRAQTNAQAHVDWEKLSLQKYLDRHPYSKTGTKRKRYQSGRLRTSVREEETYSTHHTVLPTHKFMSANNMNALNSQEVMPPAKPQAYSTPLSMVLQQAQHFTAEYPVVPIMYKGQEHMISSKQFNQLLKMTKRRETEAMLQEQHRRRSGPKRPSLRTIAAINRSRVV